MVIVLKQEGIRFRTLGYTFFYINVEAKYRCATIFRQMHQIFSTVKNEMKNSHHGIMIKSAKIELSLRWKEKFNWIEHVVIVN